MVPQPPSVEHLRYNPNLLLYTWLQKLHWGQISVRQRLTFLVDLSPTVPGPWGSAEASIWPYCRLVVPGISALWDALWTCKCNVWLYVSNATHLFVYIPKKLKLLSSLFMNSHRSTVATQQRCTTTSCTRLLCSSPTCRTQGGNCWRGSCRRTAPRGWERRMTLWVQTAEPSPHVTADCRRSQKLVRYPSAHLAFLFPPSLNSSTIPSFLQLTGTTWWARRSHPHLFPQWYVQKLNYLL